jgi:hypothetical protein
MPRQTSPPQIIPSTTTWAPARCPSATELYIDRADFERVPPKGFKRLVPGGEVRLRNAYVIRCDEVIKDGAARSWSCAVPWMRTPWARTRGPQGQGRDPLGLGDRTACMPRCASTTDCSRCRSPVRRRDFRDDLNPDSLRTLTAASSNPALAVGAAGRAAVRARGVFRRRSDSAPGAAGVQPHRDAEGHLGQTAIQARLSPALQCRLTTRHGEGMSETPKLAPPGAGIPLAGAATHRARPARRGALPVKGSDSRSCSARRRNRPSSWPAASTRTAGADGCCSRASSASRTAAGTGRST